MANIIVMQAGLNGSIDAGGTGSNGPQFPIKYFLPIYDPRIDGNIHTAGVTTSAQPFSATVDSSDTNPVADIGGGHVIFNTSGPDVGDYTVSTIEALIIDGTETTDGTDVSGCDVDSVTTINLLDNEPLVPIFSGGTLEYSSSGVWALNGATSADATTLDDTWISAVDTNNRSRFFEVTSYSPIGSGTSGTNNVMRGLFKCRMDNQVGNFKFNKIALFITEYDGSGNEVTGSPLQLIAVAGLDEPVLKTTDGYNITNVEVDIEMEFSTSANFQNNVYYSNDYWTRTSSTSAYGIWIDRDVAIGSSGTGWGSRDSKLEITSNDKAQLRLSNTSQEYCDFTVDSTGNLVINPISGTSVERSIRLLGNDLYINIDSMTYSKSLGINIDIDGNNDRGIYMNLGGQNSKGIHIDLASNGNQGIDLDCLANGDAINISASNSFTGNMIKLDMDSNALGNGLYITQTASCSGIGLNMKSDGSYPMIKLENLSSTFSGNALEIDMTSFSSCGVYINNVPANKHGISILLDGANSRGMYVKSESGNVGLYMDVYSTGTGIFIHTSGSGTDTATGISIINEADASSTNGGIYIRNRSDVPGVHINGEVLSDGSLIKLDADAGFLGKMVDVDMSNMTTHGVYVYNIPNSCNGMYMVNANSGKAINILNTGSGSSLYISNSSSSGYGIHLINGSSNAIYISNAGTNGHAINIPNSSSTGAGLYIANSGGYRGISILNSNGSGVYINNSGTTGIYINNTGTYAIQITTSSAAMALYVVHSSTGAAITVANTSSGHCFVGNTTSSGHVFYATSTSTGNPFWASSSNGACYVSNPTGTAKGLYILQDASSAAINIVKSSGDGDLVNVDDEVVVTTSGYTQLGAGEDLPDLSTSAFPVSTKAMVITGSYAAAAGFEIVVSSTSDPNLASRIVSCDLWVTPDSDPGGPAARYNCSPGGTAGTTYGFTQYIDVNTGRIKTASAGSVVDNGGLYYAYIVYADAPITPLAPIA